MATSTLGRWSGRVDPDANIYRFQHSTGADNYGKATRREIDALLDEARTEYQLEARKAIYAQIEEKVRARRNAITFQHEVLYSAHTTDLQGYALRGRDASSRTRVPRWRLPARPRRGPIAVLLLRRAVESLVALFLASIVVFVGVRSLPGDRRWPSRARDATPGERGSGPATGSTNPSRSSTSAGRRSHCRATSARPSGPASR